MSSYNFNRVEFEAIKNKTGVKKLGGTTNE